MTFTGNQDRRGFLRSWGGGFGSLALAAMAAEGAADPLAPKTPHFSAKAKRVILCWMQGGMSQMDLFDCKERLKQEGGKKIPFAVNSTKIRSEETALLLPPVAEFSRVGQCGLTMSNLMPHLAKKVDELCWLRGMVTDSPAHPGAIRLFQTGSSQFVRPSMGSWITYGLGTENRNLPAYVVLDDPKGLPINGISNWQSAWLPPIYQGTRFRTEGPPVLNLEPRAEIPTPLVEAERNLLRKLDAAHLAERPYQPELDARISSYELAARMQMAASDALDVNRETEATREAYGLNDPATASYGKRCLMARRLIERGVRFVQLYIESQIFDSHGDIQGSLNYACGKTDKPVAALVKDLKQRGLLDSTLVVWGGEFGRLPISQGAFKNAGRDHGPNGFSVWMAGGGVKGGTVFGSTDDIGFKAAENRVSVHDFHATILNQLGLKHRDLVFERHGLKERLTDQFPARVVTEILS